ncbi:hypothetical protein BpHYR1_038067 [Brachionus plicatilis]|uniref:Secreted protein n=1 Tax=Brachionus plicatilis TaxID=10195 RepID=A0A3M7R4R5_BRAPC|nr:hypothetical protein BpHYR1_038067 [Brachionus plicatilis]
MGVFWASLVIFFSSLYIGARAQSISNIFGTLLNKNLSQIFFLKVDRHLNLNECVFFFKVKLRTYSLNFKIFEQFHIFLFTFYDPCQKN